MAAILDAILNISKCSMLASLRFFKDNICTTRIHKEKKFKIKFQVLLKFAQNLPDYNEVEKSYVDKLDAKKPLDFNLLRISPEFLIDYNKFIPFLSYTVEYLMIWFSIAVRQEVKRIDNSVYEV